MNTGRIDANEEQVKLDVRDTKILALLSVDSRTPLAQIAKKVSLSRDAVDYRMKRMQRLNVIRQFIPKLDLRKFGYYTYHIFFLLDEVSARRQEELIEDLKRSPYVLSILEYSDRWDLEIVLVAKDIEEFDVVIMDIINRYPDLILEKDRIATTKMYYSGSLPNKLRGEVRPSVMKKETEFEPDRKDFEILKVITQNCRQSTYEVGRQVKLSPDAVGYRLKRLKQEGLIENFSVLVNLSALGYQMYTFAVQLRRFDKEIEMKFRAFTSQHPYIINSLKALGMWNVLIYIAADSPKEFHRTIKDIKREFSTAIINYQTWVAYKEHMYTCAPTVLFMDAEARKQARPSEE